MNAVHGRRKITTLITGGDAGAEEMALWWSLQKPIVQLPAMNTPQFSWARNRMQNRPQPVPPIFEPEVAARAILWATEHDRRQVAVGFSTALAKWAEKLAPGLADRCLGATEHRGWLLAAAVGVGVGALWWATHDRRRWSSRHL